MLNAMLVACATLIFVLALVVSHEAKAHRLARLFRLQQKWAEMMDRQRATPRRRSPCPAIDARKTGRKRIGGPGR